MNFKEFLKGKNSIEKGELEKYFDAENKRTYERMLSIIHSLGLSTSFGSDQTYTIALDILTELTNRVLALEKNNNGEEK